MTLFPAHLLPAAATRRLLLATLLAFAAPALADGGHIALHASAGPYTVTLFTAPEPLVTGPCDLSLLVQDRATDEVLESVTATATLTSPSGEAQTFPLTRAGASNKLLLAAAPVLRTPGDYELRLLVTVASAGEQSFRTTLPVARNSRRRATLVFALLLPLAVILLFLLNQASRQRLKRQAFAGRSREGP